MTGASTIPLTQAQRLVWTGQALAPESPLYNMVWRFDLDGRIDPDRFARAFRTVAARTDALRTRFVAGQGEPSQLVAHEVPDFPPLLDLGGEAEAEAWISADAAIPVDLNVSTFRTRLIRFGAERWVWYLNQHHIATDAAAGAALFRRMVAAYGDDDLAPDTPQFAAHAERESAALESGALAEAREHWAEIARHAGTSSVPYGGARQPGSPASFRLRLDFGPQRSERLKALAADRRFASIGRDLSVFALLATVLAAFLNRVTGDTTIRIGAPAHNRTAPADRETVGLYIEMFPLSLAVEPGDSFISLYRRTLAAALDYLRHAKSGASSAASVATFNAVLNYIPVRFAAFGDIPCTTRWLHAGAHDGQHDLRLHVYDFDATGSFTVEMDFNAGVFDRSRAEAATRHFLSLFDAMAADAEADPAKVPLIAPAEAEAAGSIAFGAETPVPPDILDAFAARVAEQPGATALTFGDTRVSYAALDAHADAMAAAFRAAGLRPGGAAAIWARRGPAQVAAILGAMRAGGFFVPIPSDAPPERAAAILDRLRPDCLALDGWTRPLAGDRAADAVDLGAVPEAGPPAVATPCATAYVIFTSGSTGEPKGVAVGRPALARYIDWAARSYGPAGPKSYPLCSSIGFDLTITSLFVPLVTGGEIRIHPEPETGPDLSILDVFAEDRVDVVKLTPVHLALVAETARPVVRIGTLILGGENLTTALCRRAREVLGSDIVIANEYGPTEAVVGCMIHRFDAAADNGASVPIGRPADNTAIYVLDAGGNPVPPGVTGEIAIGGDRLAEGYFEAPEATAAKFVPDPFRPDGRMYLSGDLARVDGNGVVHYLGRSDQQLKLSGIRIEPAEIEAALLAESGVRAAFVDLWVPAAAPPPARSCRRCGLSGDYPGAGLDMDGLCAICRDYDAIRDRAAAYFSTPEALKTELAEARRHRRGQYDAIMLLSGGKDSAYALYRLAELTPDILALTLDNGFISQGAKDNITRITADIGVEHRFLTTPAMNAIFRDSLDRFANVCQGCFKTIYALALKVARDEGVPAIVTGLSRGQFFETRLTPALFRDGAPARDEIDTMVLAARKAYHRMDDAVSRLLGTGSYLDDDLLDRVKFIDIYRYLDVPVAEIYRFLTERAPWVRPGDTGRSTNCLINDAGIWVHRRREGFHNYALPYSWDVRLGHKTRDEAVAELDDRIDPGKVTAILDQIGYAGGTAAQPRLVAYLVADGAVDGAALRRALLARLPREAVPEHFVALEALPLTGNGKVDRARLPRPAPSAARQAPHGPDAAPADRALAAAEGAVEATLLSVFQAVLRRDAIGVTDNFYDLGGESIAAIQIAVAARRAGLRLDPQDVFRHQTIRALAAHVQAADEAPQPESDPDQPLLDLDEAELAAVGRALQRGKAVTR